MHGQEIKQHLNPFTVAANNVLGILLIKSNEMGFFILHSGYQQW